MNDQALNRESWPTLGRVGICTKGASAGQHVLLIAENDPIAWMLYLEPPWENYYFGESRFSFDNAIIWDDAGRIVNSWGVEWIGPDGDDVRIEQDLFDVRIEITKQQERSTRRALLRGLFRRR